MSTFILDKLAKINRLKRISNIPNEVKVMLEQKGETIDFDVFEYEKIA